jgi:NADH dehydrogenase
MTLGLPVRGNIQVRAVEVAGGRITLMTLAGHPLAGAVRFVTLPIDGGVHFEIQVYDRPANMVDWVLMRPVGDQMQESTWVQLAESVAKVAGEANPQVKQAVRDLEPEDTEKVEAWAKEMAYRARRHAAAATIGDRPAAEA